jgi:ornithine decarboxylase
VCGGHILEKGTTVMHALRQVASSEAMQISNDAFYVIDLNEVKDMYRQWQDLIPRVQPYYAVKCNPDPWILRTLAELGAGFDCATPAEMEAVCDAAASVPAFSVADRVLYAHPVKQPSHVRDATALGVSMMTFDNVDELRKIAALHPRAELILRLLPDDSTAACQFGKKFGAALEELPAILQTVKDLDLNLVGVSYHIGSGPSATQPFSDAVILARAAFDLAQSFGIKLELLDIGGGFPGSSWDRQLQTKSNLFFEEVAEVLNEALDEHFPASSGVRILSEPGRYMVHSSQTLAATVIGKRVTKMDDGSKQFRYYLNDGLYGSFNCILYDHATVDGAPLELDAIDAVHAAATANKPVYSSSVWGPTCDGLDCIHSSVELPEMEVGDRMYYPNMGAYTIAAGSTFNGFPQPKKCYLV